jgi:hypothetical protein
MLGVQCNAVGQPTDDARLAVKAHGRIVKGDARVTKNHDEVVTKILSKIGDPVTFTYPDGEPDACGKLKDRYVLPAQGERSSVPYWDVVDLIEFPKEAEQEWIGLATTECRKTDSFGVAKLLLLSQFRYGDPS